MKMNKKVLLGIFVAILALLVGSYFLYFGPAISTSGLVSTKLLSDQIEISLPTDFVVMSDEIREIKYPGERHPSLIYTNEQTTINVTFKETPGVFYVTDLSDVSDEYQEVLSNQENVKSIESNEIKKVNGKDVILLEMFTSAVDTDIYILMASVILPDGDLLQVGFNCTIDQIEICKPLGKKIINSLKIL